MAVPSAVADFYTSDTGISRVIDRELPVAAVARGDAVVSNGLRTRPVVGDRVRVAKASDPFDGRVGVVVADEQDLLERRVVAAPAGVLGLHMASSAPGRPSVVSGVAPTSPLAALVSVGWQLIAVDGEDVATRGAVATVGLLQARADLPRVLTFVVKKPAERAGKTGKTRAVGDGASSSSSSSSAAADTDEARLHVVLVDECGVAETRRLIMEELEAPQRRLARLAPALHSCGLAALQRLGCALHESLAVLHVRQGVLELLCEMQWLRAADADDASAFDLSSLEGLSAPLVRLLKLSCVAEPLDEDGADTDALNIACVTAANLLTDPVLLERAPRFASLPQTLGHECTRFLARNATSVQQAETSHPSECGDKVLDLACAGATSMQLIFDSRTWLARGATLGIYLDERCTQEVLAADADDLIACEIICVPVERVWIKYHCRSNREGAWGFKLRAVPSRWRVNNEAAIADGPLEFGWEMMQLLVEEVPSAMSDPLMLANLVRYLLYGRAPHRERACLLLLRALPFVSLEDAPFDVPTLQALEQQLAWHDALLRRGSTQIPLEGTAMLPLASQALLDFLVEARERMAQCGLTPWPSSLPWLPEVCELSALTKWLLAPSAHQCPRTSARLAARASQQTEIDPRVYDRWPAALDPMLVALVNADGRSASALNLRASQLASLAEQAREAHASAARFSPGEVALRLALLQRFNQLLARHVALVHTGMVRKAETLGGRICQLRGCVLFETKLAAMEHAVSTTVSDADPSVVVLNRFKASRQRGKAEAEGGTGTGTLFVQMYDQLARVKTRQLLRHDKAFKVAFVGEAADDHGGPYREAMAEIVHELQSAALPLLIRTPNGANSVGEQRDAFVPNPSAQAAVHMEWYYFLGQLLGLALRQKETQLGLSLPSVVWKQLVNEPMDASDLAAFDAMCKQSLDKLRSIESEGIDAETFADCIFETFTAQLSDGSEVSLVPGGAHVDVTYANRHDFCDAVLHARLHEAQTQCDAMLQGLSFLVPQRVLTLLTWRELELLCCGSRDIDLELLRVKTKYGVGVSPSQRHVRYFWQALRKFSPENRAKFLRFVWGRTRLPATPAEWGDTRFTLHTRHTPRPDEAYPVAHTCFFSLELPAYTSFAVCHQRLLYAITNCLAIDIDTTTSARENRERRIEGLDDSDGDEAGAPGDARV